MKTPTVLRTLLRREIYRFARLWGQTVFPPIITTILFILIFGYSLGGLVRELHGFKYIYYILPGVTMMGVLMNAFSNTSTSLYAARFDRSIENWITCPIPPLTFQIALIVGGVTRGMMISILSLLVGVVLIGMPLAHPLLAMLWSLMVCILFACLGILSGLYAEGWDHLATVSNFVLTPLSYLGGTFYSIDLLPEPWHAISLANPLYYCIDGFRFAVLGVSDRTFTFDAALICGMCVVTVVGCHALLRRGYRLVK